ncbi:MAG: hypothetical protein QOH33_873, partial [Paraburkholderia sp.]|nr:hypothetical protein [Paraburkholderia sp.]
AAPLASHSKASAKFIANHINGDATRLACNCTCRRSPITISHVGYMACGAMTGQLVALRALFDERQQFFRTPAAHIIARLSQGARLTQGVRGLDVIVRQR